MCTFVFGVLATETDVEALRPIFERHEIGLRTAEQDGFSGVTGNIFYTTRDFCDCGTAIGSARYEQGVEAQFHNLEANAEKLQRKGWSAAKIARWRADKEQTMSRRHLPAEWELQKWMGFLPTILNEAGISWFGMFYHRHWQEQHITVEREERLRVNALSVELLKNMEADVLYRFTA
jgi:hypothetical protein